MAGMLLTKHLGMSNFGTDWSYRRTAWPTRRTC